MRCKPLLLAAVLLAGAAAAPLHAEPTKLTVFFSQWSALIDDDAAKAVQHAADAAKQGDHKVIVTGYTDTTGSEAANRLLAQLRAQMVADQLAADGVSADSITQKSDADVPSPPDSKQESRRVSIDVE